MSWQGLLDVGLIVLTGIIAWSFTMAYIDKKRNE